MQKYWIIFVTLHHKNICMGRTSHKIKVPTQRNISDTLSLTVGKDVASISGISVTEWGTGWEESGTATPVINLKEGETLTNDMISESINNGRLVVKGDLSNDALTTLESYIIDHPEYIKTLDMGNCDITEIPANFIYGIKGGFVVEPDITTLILPKGTITIGDNAFISTEIRAIKYKLQKSCDAFTAISF